MHMEHMKQSHEIQNNTIIIMMIIIKVGAMYFA